MGTKGDTSEQMELGALPMPLDKILLYEPACACLLGATFCVCAHVEQLQGNYVCLLYW